MSATSDAPRPLFGRGRRRSAAAHPYGFYDTDAMIVVVAGSDELDPFVVVDHEATHVTLVNESTLGLLEQVLSYIRWLALGTLDPAAHPAFALAGRPIGILRGATTDVHEAVAWFGTEMQTRGRENTRAPKRYRRGVDLLHRTVASLVGVPAEVAAEPLLAHFEIAEAIAIVALSPPAAAAAFQADTDFESAVTGAGAQVWDRFVRICGALGGRPFADVRTWARAVWRAAERGDAPRSEAGVEMLPRHELDDAALALAARLRRKAGAEELPRDELDERWRVFLTMGMVTPALDVWSQTCVVPASATIGRRDVRSGDVPPPQLLTSSSLVVSRASSHGDSLAWRQPVADDTVVVFGDVGRSGDYVVWATTRSAARGFLELAAGTLPIVVSGVGYDYDRGDFDDPLLGDLPHAVIRLGDLKSFWFGTAVNRGYGLAGSKIIDWMPLPAATKTASHFGYIALRPADRSWPVVLNPCVAARHERIVSVVDRLPSPHGVELHRRDDDDVGDWLGPLTPSAAAAAAEFERQCT